MTFHNHYLPLSVSNLAQKVLEHIDLNHGVDLAARNFIHSRLPLPGPKNLVDVDSITAKSKFRALRRDIARTIQDKETGGIFLFFCLDNSIHFQEKPPQYLEVDPLFHDALKKIFESYPEFMNVHDLPVIEFSGDEEAEAEDMVEDYVELVKALANSGILEVKNAVQ